MKHVVLSSAMTERGSNFQRAICLAQLHNPTELIKFVLGFTCKLLFGQNRHGKRKLALSSTCLWRETESRCMQSTSGALHFLIVPA